MRFFGVIWIRTSDPRSLGSWYIKGTHEPTLVSNSSIPLMSYDLSDLGTLILIGEYSVFEKFDQTLIATMNKTGYGLFRFRKKIRHVNITKGRHTRVLHSRRIWCQMVLLTAVSTKVVPQKCKTERTRQCRLVLWVEEFSFAWLRVKAIQQQGTRKNEYICLCCFLPPLWNTWRFNQATVRPPLPIVTFDFVA